MSQIETVATRAVFHLQYSSRKAAQYIVGEVPSTTFEDALKMIDKVARPQKKG